MCELRSCAERNREATKQLIPDNSFCRIISKKLANPQKAQQVKKASQNVLNNLNRFLEGTPYALLESYSQRIWRKIHSNRMHSKKLAT